MKAFLIISSIVVILLEAMLQWMQPAEKIYNHPEIPGIYDHFFFAKWKKGRANREKSAGEKVELLSGGIEYEATRGWDLKTPQRARNNTYSCAGGNKKLVVFAGDSFTFGSEVNDDECFANLVQQDSDFCSINLGVPGYGTDQSYMKVGDIGLKHNPKIIVFGIHYPGDINRMGLSFFSFSKPVLKINDNKLSITTPLAPETIGHFLINEEWSLYNSRLAASAVVAYSKLNRAFLDKKNNELINTYGMLTQYIVKDLVDKSHDFGFKLFIILFPLGEAFSDENAYHLTENCIERQIIMKAIHAYDVPYVDFLERFTDGGKYLSKAEGYYIRRPNGTIGHFSPAGNRFVATVLKKELSALIQTDSSPLPREPSMGVPYAE